MRFPTARLTDRVGEDEKKFMVESLTSRRKEKKNRVRGETI